MRKVLLTLPLLALVAALVAPTADAKISTKGLPKFLHGEESALDGKGDRNGIGMFKRNSENKKYVFANGKVTAVSATSITVEVRSKKSDDNSNSNSNSNANTNATIQSNDPVVVESLTFGVDNTTKVIRKYKGTASIAEVAVGDKVMIWGTKFEGGVAKLIWDKSIWWGQIKGTVTDLNTTAKTFKLVLKQKETKSGKTITVAATIKTTDTTKYWMGDVEKAFTDLANDQKVTVRGSWNSVGKYFLASKVTITE